MSIRIYRKISPKTELLLTIKKTYSLICILCDAFYGMWLSISNLKLLEYQRCILTLDFSACYKLIPCKYIFYVCFTLYNCCKLLLPNLYKSFGDVCLHKSLFIKVIDLFKLCTSWITSRKGCVFRKLIDIGGALIEMVYKPLPKMFSPLVYHNNQQSL